MQIPQKSLHAVILLILLLALVANSQNVSRDNLSNAEQPGGSSLPKIDKSILNEFYRIRRNQRAWLDARNRPNAYAEALRSILLGADEHGLNPKGYWSPTVERFWNSQQTDGFDLEILLSHLYIKFAADVSRGKLSPQDADPDTLLKKEAFDLQDTVTLDRGLRNYSPQRFATEFIDKELAPQHKQYRLLKEELSRLLAIKRHNGQKANGGLDKKIRQIQVNMDRYRWLPRELGDRHIIVNIALSELHYFEHGQSVLEMKVVNGRPQRPTPTMVDDIVEVVFNPYWNVPTVIVLKDLLPKLKKNPHLLAEMNYTLLEGGRKVADSSSIKWTQFNDDELTAKSFFFTIRAEPGPHNAMGLIKFRLNKSDEHEVFLHDTNEKQLLEKKWRKFSSGCVRISRPFELAEKILATEPGGWTPSKIRAKRLGESPGRIEEGVTLQSPVKVYFYYFSAQVKKRENGTATLVLGEDDYGQDARMFSLWY